MYIEIYGAKFINKGAELMLNSIIEKISARYPQAKFVLSCSSKKEFDLLTRNEFYKKITYRKHLLDFGDLGRFIPRIIREKNKIVLNSEIDVVFEASGFAYGDQWTYRLAKFMDKNIKKWKKQNTKVIIMPQAFGPFNKEINAKFTKSFIDNADLVYIRDKESLIFVKELGVKKEKLNLCPDFSIALNAKQTDSYNYLKNMICLIPNNKVITTSSDIEIKDKYISFFTNIIKYYKSKFKNVFLLNHEGQGDYDLALDIQKENPEIEIIWEKDPLIIKYIVGNSRTVVGSRFHGLVNALSQATPAYAIGWSHKYEMLFEDFGFPEGILDIDMNNKELTHKLNLIEEETTRIDIINNIVLNGEKLKDKVNKMWDEVYNLIDAK